jgi:DNA-binding beta-propeller fold protein YncE
MKALPFVACLALIFTCTASAADPYASTGFLKFPAEVELGAVSAVAIGKEDQIYVLHRGEPPLVEFSADGEFVRGWGQGMFKVPHGLRVDGGGNIWTTDNGNHVLRKFTPDGKLAATLGTEGKPASGKEGFRAPDDVVFDSQGNLYVADSGNGRIVTLAPDGAYVTDWGKKGKAAGQFATAHALAIDEQDHIYVADRGNNRIQVFDASGKHLADWSGFGNPFGLLVVGDELLVSEGDIHKIFHLDRAGKVPGQIAGRIVAEWGGPETLKLPHLMAVDAKGTLYVAEVNGKRVQLFRRNAR